jgi:hypothetical protein
MDSPAATGLAAVTGMPFFTTTKMPGSCANRITLMADETPVEFLTVSSTELTSGSS